ncbi:MAG: AMP-binding protein [Agathobacter sp.]|nr:AMP-binding protein [Agathobacter sp.]
MENINRIVKETCKALRNSNKTFEDMYAIMFRFQDNIMAEKSTMMGIKEYTYKEIQCEVEKIAAAIAKKTKVTNQFMGIYADNCVEWIVLFWAILRSGNHPYLINLRQPDSFTSHILGILKANFVLCVDKAKDFGCESIMYEELENLNADASELEGVPFGNEIAITTSATTLKEKICIYQGENFANQVLNTQGIVERGPWIKRHYKGRLKQLAFLPLYHIFGLTAVYFWFCFFGRTLVFVSDYTPDTLLSTIRRHEVTHVFAVPLLWHTIEKSVLREVASMDEKTQKKFEFGRSIVLKLQGFWPALGQLAAKVLFKEVRINLFGESVLFCISGGSYVRNSALDLVNAIGYPLHNGYGMSEIGITSVELSKNVKDRLKASIGMAFDSVEYSIDEQGQLLVKGDSLCQRMIVAGEEVTYDSWFPTGDIVERDEEGRYYIKGRLSDVVLGEDGENLNPDLAEQAFTLSYAKNFCVTGNEEKNKLILIVQIAPDLVQLQREKLLQEIEECNKKLDVNYQVREIYYTYDPIQNENAIKVSRAYVARQIAEGKVQLFQDIKEKAVEAEETEIKAVIRKVFAKVLMVEPETIGDNDHFMFDLGGSSLDYFAVIGELSEKFSIKFMFEEEDFGYSVSAFEEIVRKHLE